MAESAKPNNPKSPATSKKAVIKSPKWPILTLTDALEKAKTIYGHEKRNPTTVEVMMGHLGLKSNTGRANRTLAALRAYGLVQRQPGGAYVITDSAWKILVALPQDSPERVQLMRQAALSPSLFKEIVGKYPDDMPSDASLRSYLILNKGFNENTVGQFLTVFKAALAIDKLGGSDYTPDISEDENDENEEDSQMQQQHTPAARESAGKSQVIPPSKLRFFTDDGRPLAFRKSTELAFPLSRGSEAKVTILGDATQEAIDKLVQHLNLSKDTFPTKSEVDDKENRRAATWRNKDHDQPVTVTGELGKGKDGRNYLKIAESQVGVPEDEIEFEDAQAKGAA